MKCFTPEIYKETEQYSMFDEEIPYTEIQTNYSEEEKRSLWDIGIGLQQVDNLSPSDYLLNMANEEIASRTSYTEIERNLIEYYQNQSVSTKEEADIVSLRITRFLAENNKQVKIRFNPSLLTGIHSYLFHGVKTFTYPVGKFRTVNITKQEAVLNGESVLYTPYQLISSTLEYDFASEQEVDYRTMEHQDKAYSAMQFISNIWQIHPFREGNTRTCAVLAILYFQKLGFQLDNTMFKEHSKYFRDCLVAANAAENIKTNQYLNLFVDNLVLGYSHKLPTIQLEDFRSIQQENRER